MPADATENIVDITDITNNLTTSGEHPADDDAHNHYQHHQHARDIDDLINATDAVNFQHAHDDDNDYNHHDGDDHFANGAINDDDPDHLADTFSHQPAAGSRPSRRPQPPQQLPAERQRCRRQHYAPAIDHIRLDAEEAARQAANGSPGLHRPTTELWLDNDELAAEAQRRRFQLNKQHTGMKNMSFNVTAAVAPAPRSAAPAAHADVVGMDAAHYEMLAPAGLVVNGDGGGGNHHQQRHHHYHHGGAAAGRLSKTFVEMKPRSSAYGGGDAEDGGPAAGIPAYRPVVNQLCESAQIAEAQRLLQLQQLQQKTHAEQPEGVTDQGYFDLKFYHNKLW